MEFSFQTPEDEAFNADLRKRVKHHPPSHPGIAAKHEDFRQAIFIMGQVIGTLVPKGREQALAITKLEEVMFWGNAGIARNQENALPMIEVHTQTHQFTSNPTGGDNCVCGQPWNVAVHK